MPTLKDVANLAGVSSASVSRILNNDMTLNVPQATRDKVIEAAAQLGYVKKKKKDLTSNMHVGIVQWMSAADEVNDPYYLSIRQGVENYCALHKISTTRCFANELDIPKRLEKVDGIVCIGKFAEEDRTTLMEACSNIIFLDMKIDPITACCIVPDFKGALRIVIDFFKQEGFTQVGYLGGIEHLHGRIYPDDRLKHFRRFAAQANFDYHPYVRIREFSRGSGYDMMKNLIDNNQVPQAIFAASDPIAIGAIKACHEAGIRIPEDLSIIGFDDIDASNYTYPPLSTIFVPTYEIGTTGVRMLHDAWKRNENLYPMKVELPCYLIKRQTTRSTPDITETEPPLPNALPILL